MIVDGKAIAKNLLATVVEEVRILAKTPRLGILTCAPGPETKQYLDLKKRRAEQVGIALIVLELPREALTADCVASVQSLVQGCHGVLVQLPLPKHIDREEVLSVIPVHKDPDGFNYGHDERSILPPVPGAIEAIAKEYKIDFENKKVVVVGDGRLVGRPACIYTKDKGARVVSLTEHSDNYAEEIATADILITGVGKAHFITRDMVKEGVMVFDAGASEDGGLVVGDVHPDVQEVAALFTPVPGGIGPVTVAVLLHNVVVLMHSAQQESVKK